ncbi:MAG: hypothetical protein KF901_30415, partial [Myxococcales bacterium]|nr:hypothetical protein [Myxococcales bacterium]
MSSAAERSWWPVERWFEPSLGGARLILVGDDPVLTDGLVQALRAQDCAVGVTDSRTRGLSRLGFLDAQAVLFDPTTVVEARLRRALDREPRLRGATLTPFSWEQVWPPDADGPELASIVRVVDEALRPDRELRDRARASERFAVPYELIGPARALRALSGATEGVLRIVVSSEDVRAVVELAGDLVVSAALLDVTSDRLLIGAPALRALLDERTLQAHAEHHALAQHMTVMTTLAVALDPSIDAAPYEELVTAPRDVEKLVSLRARVEAEQRAHLARLELARRGGDEAPHDEDPWALESTTARRPLGSLVALAEHAPMDLEGSVTAEAEAYRPDELLSEAKTSGGQRSPLLDAERRRTRRSDAAPRRARALEGTARPALPPVLASESSLGDELDDSLGYDSDSITLPRSDQRVEPGSRADTTPRAEATRAATPRPRVSP